MESPQACSALAARTIILVLFFLTTLTTAEVAPRRRGIGSRQANESSWQQYVRSPSTRTITPVAYLEEYSSGNITNPGGIVGDGVTTLTRLDSSDEPPSIVLDFGQNHAGVLSIKFAGASSPANTTAVPGLTLAFSETLEYLTNRSDFTRSDNQAAGDKVTNGTDQVAVQPEPYIWTNQLGCAYNDSGVGKVCSDGFHGFRYLRITLQALDSDAPYTTGLGSVSIEAVSLAFSGFLGTPDTFTGWFECSDEDLTRWWYDAVYTNDMCTDTFRANDTEPRNAASPSLLGKEVLHDGAKRDRDPYVGDLAVSALTLFLSHDNPAAARNVLADLADHQRADGWIPPASINNYTLALFDYPLWWVVCSSDLVLYAGDTAYLDEYYDNMVLTLDTYYPNATNEDGLLQKGLGTTSGYGDYAFLPRSGTITYYNALYVLALKRAAQLADVKGESEDASRWRARADSIGRKCFLSFLTQSKLTLGPVQLTKPPSCTPPGKLGRQRRRSLRRRAMRDQRHRQVRRPRPRRQRPRHPLRRDQQQPRHDARPRRHHSRGVHSLLPDARPLPALRQHLLRPVHPLPLVAVRPARLRLHILLRARGAPPDGAEPRRRHHHRPARRRRREQRFRRAAEAVWPHGEPRPLLHLLGGYRAWRRVLRGGVHFSRARVVDVRRAAHAELRARRDAYLSRLGDVRCQACHCGGRAVVCEGGRAAAGRGGGRGCGVDCGG